MSQVLEIQHTAVSLAPIRSTPSRHLSLRSESPCSKNTGSKLSKRQLFALLTMLLLYFADFAILSIMEPFLPSEAKSKGLSPAMNGLIFSIYSFVIVVMSPVYSTIIPIVNPRTLYLIGISLNVFSNICFGMIHFINDQSVFIVISL